ncbi:PGG domain [Dillenia turbinata]|uniref:PGG domain n=1 Tax=Dillenia turbinata TaxID=194707 RepID=A0AAN8ZHH3_9MAGN
MEVEIVGKNHLESTRYQRGSMKRGIDQPARSGGDWRMMEKRLFEASLSGRVESLRELMEEDRLILARVSVTCFDESPLHIAAMLGHAEFGKTIVLYKPDMVTDLNLQGRTPLHLAAALGHVELVKMLVSVDSNVCSFHDEDGYTPLHLAVIKGQIGVMKELLIAQPGAVRCTMDGGETLLHTCVKSNRLEALKLLVDLVSLEGFISFRDDDGNTILHIATLMKQMETVKYLLKRTGVKLNEINANGFTALDIICQMPRDLKVVEIREVLQEAGALRARKLPPSARDAVPHHVLGDFPQTAGQAHPSPEGNGTKKNVDKLKWVKKKRDALMVAATVIAAMAYQAGLNPPSSVWNPDYNYTDPVTNINITYYAGTSIMADNYPDGYILFWKYNTTSFLASMSTVLLLLSGLPLKHKFFMWILMAAMWVTMSSMALTYLTAMQAISPAHEDNKISHVVRTSIFIWLGLIGLVFLVHTCRFLKWCYKKDRAMMEKRIYEASQSGNVDSLNKLIEEDRLILSLVLVTCFVESPLHIATGKSACKAKMYTTSHSLF